MAHTQALVPGAIVIPAAEAAFSRGAGLSIENRLAETAYDGAHGMIVNLARGGEIAFTLPDGVDGVYDVYLTVGKIMAQSTSQPFCFRVGGGALYSVPVDCQVAADSPAAYVEDGAEYNTGTLMDAGRFRIAAGAALRAGDEVTIIAAYGAQADNLVDAAFPAVGALTLAPVGSPVPTGYDDTVKAPEAPDPGDPLSGLNILWLGSSVTYGAASGGHYSMVDAIRDRHPATVCEKYAISGSMLVNQSEDSYVARLMRIPKDRRPDLMVVQLSTNDAFNDKPLGSIAEGRDRAAFDDTTITGAIETIIAYARETFHCPVVFYTGTFCANALYARMVRRLLDIQRKWDIGVIDMFNDAAMTALYGTERYSRYMRDEVHPFRRGYVEWWTPVIDGYLIEYMRK